MKNKLHNVAVLLHNIRSVHNVGSIFRTADALGVSEMWLSGYTPMPLDRFGRPRNDVAKVALGAEKTIPWHVADNPAAFIRQWKKKGFLVVAIEQASRAVDYKTVRIRGPVLFIVGNEVDGIEKNLLRLADVVAEIPMRGAKESLNVSVAFGVGLYRMLDQ